MKKIVLLSVFFLSGMLMAYSNTVTLTESSGWLESAFVKWLPVSGATSYNVYYTGEGVTDKKIDNQLIRSYGTYMRADIPGLKAGSYTVSVAAVVGGVEQAPTVSGAITVLAPVS